MMRVHIDCGFALQEAVTPQACTEMGLIPGAQVTAVLRAPPVHLLERFR
jgi:molybdopterin-binding protein